MKIIHILFVFSFIQKLSATYRKDIHKIYEPFIYTERVNNSTYLNCISLNIIFINSLIFSTDNLIVKFVRPWKDLHVISLKHSKKTF